MRLLGAIWEDVKQGENLDLYVTVLVSLVLALLNTLGVAPSTLVTPLNLAILALLAVALVGNRHRLEVILQSVIKGTGGLLHIEFEGKIQEEIEKGIERAKDLLIIGATLERTLRLHFRQLEKKLKEGVTIRVVLIDPNTAACEGVVKRYYRGQTTSLELERAQIQATLKSLADLQSRTSGKLEVRLIDYPFPRGGIILDPDSPNGVLYLWDYGFKATRSAKFVLRPEDGYWYNHFRDEAYAVWDNAATYQAEKSSSS